jgi:endonuclease-3
MQYNLAMNAEKRVQIFSRWKALNPEPVTELEYSSPFELLIAVLLSAQATDVSVNLATRTLFPAANTPQAMLKLGVPGVKEHIRRIGLFNTKAANVIKTCQILVDEYNGEVPQKREQLEALPGVGRKTANVVLNTAFRQIAMAVDTHIFRVSNRTGIAPGKNVLEVEKRLLRLVPDEFLLDAHHWLILHGRYVCVARKPRCPECPIAELCEYKKKTPAPPTEDETKTGADLGMATTRKKRKKTLPSSKSVSPKQTDKKK